MMLIYIHNHNLNILEFNPAEVCNQENELKNLSEYSTMEEFSDLDEETGTNIAHINNLEISRNIVEPIEYHFPNLNNKIQDIKQFDDLSSNLIKNNNNLINIENNLNNKTSNNILLPKKNYLNDFERLIDQEFSHFNETKNFDIRNKDYLIDKNEVTNNFNSKNIQREKLNLNRFIEITKNYNKIPKREKSFDNNVPNRDLISADKNILNIKNEKQSNAFASNVLNILNFIYVIFRFIFTL